MFLQFSMTVAAITFFLLISIAILWNKWCFTYWEKKNVPCPKPRFILGNSQNPLARSLAAYEHIKNVYDQMKSQNYLYCGIYMFTRPAYLPIHPEYIKHVMSKDFANFVDRGMYFNEKHDPLSAHLLSLEGEKWRNLRSKLTPTFSTGKMKTMFCMVVDCGDQMLQALSKLADKPLDIKEICACYTTDVIGSCAFGLDCNSFSITETEFRKYGKKAFDMSTQNVLRIVFCTLFSKLAKRIGVRLIDPEVSEFFMNIIRSTLDYRQSKHITRNDFLQLLIDLNENNELSIEEVAAQAFLFFLAGFETSSTTMSSCLYELAKNTHLQDKAREEIEEVMRCNNGKLTYECIMEMHYLQQIIDETLRLYPSVPFIQRICTKDYKLCGSDVTIEKGTRVFLPVFALHRDPEYYPDPEKFDPARFRKEEKSKRHPFVYLPFGEGPRVCIGQRFGLMQVKIGLAMLLRKYKFTTNPRTKDPLAFDRNNFLLTFKDKIWLDAIRL